jgi:hypothetical protein
MQYQVPQFIEIEDKIIGPMTLKQFVMVLIPTGVIFLLWFLLSFTAWLVIAVPVGALGAAVAFLKIGGEPFYRVAGAALEYAAKPHLYLWKQIPIKAPAPKKSEPAQPSALRKLAGKLNIFHN